MGWDFHDALYAFSSFFFPSCSAFTILLPHLTFMHTCIIFIPWLFFVLVLFSFLPIMLLSSACSYHHIIATCQLPLGLYHHGLFFLFCSLLLFPFRMVVGFILAFGTVRLGFFFLHSGCVMKNMLRLCFIFPCFPNLS